MTLVETRILVSSVDRDFVQRLHDLQQSELTKAFDITARDVIAKTVYQPAIEEELERRREKWGFDGSVILGRIDTATRRLYIGTRRVLEDGEPILHSIDEPEVAELAAASAANPGQVLLKRQLRVDGWTITESTTEFDNRPAPVAPGHQPGRDGRGLGRLVDELDAQQATVLELLRQALARVNSGEVTPTEAPLAIASWNDRLADAARTAGLDPATTGLETLREHVAKDERQRRLDAARILQGVLREHPDLADILIGMLNLPDHIGAIPLSEPGSLREMLEPTCSGMVPPTTEDESWL